MRYVDDIFVLVDSELEAEFHQAEALEVFTNFV